MHHFDFTFSYLTEADYAEQAFLLTGRVPKWVPTASLTPDGRRMWRRFFPTEAARIKAEA